MSSSSSSSRFDLVASVPKSLRGDEPSEVIGSGLVFLSGHPTRFRGSKPKQAAVHVSKYMKQNHNISLIVNCCASPDVPTFIVEDLAKSEKRAVASLEEFLELIKEWRTASASPSWSPSVFFHLNLALEDKDDEDISVVFDTSNAVMTAFLGHQLERVMTSTSKSGGGEIDVVGAAVVATHGVLVHCHAGASRSVSVLAAFLMKYCEEGDSEKVIAFLESRRSTVNPNPGYRALLKEYGAKFSKKNRKHKEISSRLESQE